MAAQGDRAVSVALELVSPLWNETFHLRRP